MDGEASMLSLLKNVLLDERAEPIDLPVSLLKAITKDFAHDMLVGSGGFAAVYKGVLGNGATVAVKKLSNKIDMDENKYNQEVGCLMSVRHKNIVRFLGYCANTHGKMLDFEGKFVMADVRHRLLCFEYLRKGSLHGYLNDSSCALEWRKCYKILKGICEGLCYLHQKRILHLDLKPDNILLDDNMVPKISDFGLSRCFDEKQSRAITSKLYGTMGYLAPEFHRGVITFKSDIYSLGVIFTEILTGQKGCSSVDNVLERWRNRFDVPPGDILMEQIRVCAEISIECVNFDPEKRPVIERIIQKLDETETADRFTECSTNNSMVVQKVLSPTGENRPAQQSTERRQEENCFGEAVDNRKLDELVRYMGKAKTQEDRARQAWRLMNEGDKKDRASGYVDLLKSLYGNGQSTLCLVYNATGDALRYVADHDWYGYIGSRVGYPAEIGNGQWAAFHHVHRLGEPSGSMGAVVYRGKKRDGQDQDYLLAWSTPWGFYYRNKAYGEIGGVDYFRRRWDEIYVKVDNSDYSSHSKSGGCEIEAKIDRGDSPKFTATLKMEHGP